MKVKIKRNNNKFDKDIIRIACFVLFDALVFQEALAGINPQITSLRKITKDFQSSLIKEWTFITEKINYSPIFQIALEILKDFSSSPETENILKELSIIAIDALSSGIVLKHDFMGRIYHKLLLRTTGEYYATYYTSIPAAWLLANLIFKTPKENWQFSSIEDIKKLKIIDPACGSGTLLSASYMAIKDMYILSRPDDLNLKTLHKYFLEEIIHGWDILDYASHLTLTTLALHNYSSEFKRSNIYRLPTGVSSTGIVHLGSLSFLKTQGVLVGRGFGDSSVQKGMDTDVEVSINPPVSDVVIMNPPFSRSAKPNIKFGYSTEVVKKLMDKELIKLTQQIGMAGIGQAGLGAPFILLANKLLKPEGRIGIVIPRALLSGVSWAKIRDLLFNNYEIKYIISNFDPGDKSNGIEPWNWSEKTDLGEVLIIAEKTDKPKNKRYVAYLSLWNKPKNEVESLLISQQVINSSASLTGTILDSSWISISLNNKEVGILYKVPQEILDYNWLYPCLFANPSLNKLIIELIKLNIFPKTKLETLAKDLGTDIKQVKTYFEQSKSTTSFSLLWGHQGSMNTLYLGSSFIGYGKPKAGAKSKALFDKQKSSLLIAERPHLKTENLLCVETSQEVLATAFWEIQLQDNQLKPLLILWLNSTLGFLLYLSVSTNSMGEIFKTKKDQLKYLPIVRPESINLQKCHNLYNNIKLSTFSPFPEEFKLAYDGKGVRKIIDDFFLKELRLDLDLKPYYKMLAEEPMISLKRI